MNFRVQCDVSIPNCMLEVSQSLPQSLEDAFAFSDAYGTCCSSSPHCSSEMTLSSFGYSARQAERNQTKYKFSLVTLNLCKVSALITWLTSLIVGFFHACLLHGVKYSVSYTQSPLQSLLVVAIKNSLTLLLIGVHFPSRYMQMLSLSLITSSCLCLFVFLPFILFPCFTLSLFSFLSFFPYLSLYFKQLELNILLYLHLTSPGKQKLWYVS